MVKKRNERYIFTKKRLDEIEPSEKRTFVLDEKQKGLRLQITPAGTKSFQFQGWSPAKQRSITQTLGRFGDISISDARKAAAKHLSDTAMGEDVEQRRREQRAAAKLSEVFESYEADYSDKKRSWKEMKRCYNNTMKKQLGSFKALDITREKVKAWHNKVGRERGHYAANRALALLRVIYSSRFSNLENPCVGVEKFKEQERERWLEPVELQAFFEALEEEKQIYQDLFNLLLLTGARKNNVLSMQWDEVRSGVWHIPASKAKANKIISVPLVGRALDIFERRRADSLRAIEEAKKLPVKTVRQEKHAVHALKLARNGQEYVFPSDSTSGHLADPKGPWGRILKAAEIDDLRIHDLRRTVGSYQAATGANTAVIGKTLGHNSAKTTAIYTRLSIDPVRDSLNKATDAMYGGSGYETK